MRRTRVPLTVKRKRVFRPHRAGLTSLKHTEDNAQMKKRRCELEVHHEQDQQQHHSKGVWTVQILENVRLETIKNGNCQALKMQLAQIRETVPKRCHRSVGQAVLIANSRCIRVYKIFAAGGADFSRRTVLQKRNSEKTRWRRMVLHRKFLQHG